MTSRLFALKPDNTLADALQLMHSKQVRHRQAVNSAGVFIGLFIAVKGIEETAVLQVFADRVINHTGGDIVGLCDYLGRG
ncbi:MAG: hypothetical protein LJE92_16995 [Gammaproteobacteria bacterium]|jgi:Na+/H+ antiporter NhaD/arsenite permease-like protein|nr:hypothetical protein [Gammaproteobacteria bacterium]